MDSIKLESSDSSPGFQLTSLLALAWRRTSTTGSCPRASSCLESSVPTSPDAPEINTRIQSLSPLERLPTIGEDCLFQRTRKQKVMNVEIWVWLITIGVFSAVILGDLVYQVRNPHEPGFRESAIQSVIYISLALLFALVIGLVWPGQYAGEYLGGFITEKALSVDNLFVFLVIFTQFKVPRKLQSEALLIGIVIALVLRGIFIAAGAAFIENFSWAFYAFGAFLLLTAIKLIKDTSRELNPDAEHEDFEDGRLIRFIQGRFRSTSEYHGTKLVIIENGKRVITPLLLVMVAIGFTDLLFALDSIPAVYGLTNEPYIVFVANAFALLGLRQLYFLLSGLMQRLRYLGFGLSLILAWIGIKLVIHALHKNEVPFINGGEAIKVIPEISTGLSLIVILITLTVTTVWSLLATKNIGQKDN
jgi:tellurite resistance protein TerC